MESNEPTAVRPPLCRRKYERGLYFLYVRSTTNGHKNHLILLGIFPPSYFWSDVCNLAYYQYGRHNVVYRFHMITPG